MKNSIQEMIICSQLLKTSLQESINSMYFYMLVITD